jgi:hypothetical protein
VRLHAAAARNLSASGDVRGYAPSVLGPETAGELSGDDNAVPSLAVDHMMHNLITVSSDCTLRLWT